MNPVAADFLHCDYQYRLFGLRISSTLALSALSPSADEGAPCDIFIRARTEEGSSEAPDGAGYFCARDSGFELFIRGVARFSIRGGCEIDIAVFPAADMERVRLFLLGSAMGALLYQRGFMLLHASAIATPRGARIFIGAQGEGKSTIAAHLYRRGYSLLSDDVCPVEIAPDGQLRMYSAHAQLRLCADAVEGLDNWSALAARRFDIDKFVVPLAGGDSPVSSPIAGIYLLQSTGEADVSLERVTGFDCIQALLANCYRPEYLRELRREGAVMQLAAKLAAAVPLYRLMRPRDIRTMAAALDVLEAHWEMERT